MNDNHIVALFSDAAQHLARKSLFWKLNCSQAACSLCRWRINSQWRFLHSILVAKPLPTKNLLKVPGDPCLLFEFHAWVFGPCCQSWPMCTRCTQQCYGPYSEHPGSFHRHLPDRIETDHRELPIWSQTGWIPGQKHYIRGKITLSSETSKFSWQSRIRQIDQGITALPGIRDFFKKNTQVGWKS